VRLKNNRPARSVTDRAVLLIVELIRALARFGRFAR
jgi:hypothetical protein